MKISKIYIYPIKSLRGTEVSTAKATNHGFPHDRQFMLLKDHGEHSGRQKRFENMAVSNFPEMALFLVEIQPPSEGCQKEILVTYAPPDAAKKTLQVPLEPNVAGLDEFEVNLHGSYTPAHRMPKEYENWFTACFGFPVVFVYVGENRRPVLFKKRPETSESPQSWLGYLKSQIYGSVNNQDDTDGDLTFADCAPYLVVSEKSLQDVSRRLPPDLPMDVRKFRPNIVISGADEEWEEDFWQEIQVTNSKGTSGNEGNDFVTLSLPHNCVRCRSLNVDFKTGKYGTDAAGQVLKLMQKDRRVDKGIKWSPVFGRYGFLLGDGGQIGVGEEVVVVKRNTEQSSFTWPGLSDST